MVFHGERSRASRPDSTTYVDMRQSVGAYAVHALLVAAVPRLSTGAESSSVMLYVMLSGEHSEVRHN